MSEERQAAQAVTEFLASFGLTGGTHLERLTAHAIARGRGRYAKVDLAGAAVRSVRADLEAWAAFVLGEATEGASPLSRIRAAYLRCGGAARWPDALCCYDLTETCVAELREAAPPRLPPEAPSAMPQQALERWSVADLASAPGRTRPVAGSERRTSPISAA